VYHLDRFARDLVATLDYLRRFTRHGVDLSLLGVVRNRTVTNTKEAF
jgi:hypothetical protein